jgi:hypothetical protein
VYAVTPCCADTPARRTEAKPRIESCIGQTRDFQVGDMCVGKVQQRRAFIYCVLVAACR